MEYVPMTGLPSVAVDAMECCLGDEKTPSDFVAHLVHVFRQVWDVLRDDGVLFLNLGDSYNGITANRTGQNGYDDGRSNRTSRFSSGGIAELKPKNLIGIPWRVALALQADGWILRQDIIWAKPNPMPESVTDRCTKSHEYLFMFSKSQKYFYDADAIKEAGTTHENRPHGITRNREYGYDSKENKLRGVKVDKQRGHSRRHAGFNERWDAMTKEQQCSGMRNKRSVWNVATQPYSEAHFATFPLKIIEPAVLAGCPIGGTVLDPFGGSGTTAQVARSLGRKGILCEANEEYIEIMKRRLNADQEVMLL